MNRSRKQSGRGSEYSFTKGRSKTRPQTSHRNIAAAFRRMLTLEQFRSTEMQRLYQQYLAAGPLGYMTDLFRSLRIPDADQMALAFYGPMYLLYSCYDGAEEKQAVFVLLEEHLDRMYKTLKVGGEL